MELSKDEIKNEIIHYLHLLKFIKPLNITDETINKIKFYLDSLEPIIKTITNNYDDHDNDFSESSRASSDYNPLSHPAPILPPITPYQNFENSHYVKHEIIEKPKIIIPNPIIDIEDKILKLAFVRDAEGITIDHNKLIYNKKKYKFDNVFKQEGNNEDQNMLLSETVKFLEKRIEAAKDSSLILYGYSGSGKSTLTNNLLMLINNQGLYKLYEIYLNKTFVYYNGKKIELRKEDDINDKKYIFQSSASNFFKILNNFKTIGSTEANQKSSRAHCVISLFFENDLKQGSELKIIDCCGNERNHKKSFFSNIDQEGQYINKSLFSLSQYLKDSRFKNNKCALYNTVKGVKNIAFLLLFHDSKKLKSTNHLMIFKDLYK